MDPLSNILAIHRISNHAILLITAITKCVERVNSLDDENPDEIQQLFDLAVSLFSDLKKLNSGVDAPHVATKAERLSKDLERLLEDCADTLDQLKQIADKAGLAESGYVSEPQSKNESIGSGIASTSNRIFSKLPAYTFTHDMMLGLVACAKLGQEMTKRCDGWSRYGESSAFGAFATDAEKAILKTVKSKTWQIIRAKACGRQHKIDLMQHQQGDRLRIVSDRLIWVGVLHRNDVGSSYEDWKKGFHFVDPLAALSRVGNTVYAKIPAKANLYRQTWMLVCKCDLELTFSTDEDATEVFNCLDTLLDLRLRTFSRPASSLVCLSGDRDLAGQMRSIMEALTVAELHDVYIRWPFEQIRALSCFPYASILIVVTACVVVLLVACLAWKLLMGATCYFQFNA